MPAGRVVVVDVVEQVAENDQLIDAAGDVGKAVDVAVDVGDEREAHRVTVGVDARALSMTPGIDKTARVAPGVGSHPLR